MSQVAIQGGKMTQAYALLATTMGREKVYRLAQYLARLVAWFLIRRGNVDAALRFTNLRNGLLTARRAMRLFRNGEFLRAAIQLSKKPITALSAPGQLAHLAQIGRQLGYMAYYATDQMVWFASVGFTRPDKERLARIQRISYRSWLIGILLSLSSTTASLVKLRADGKRFALAASAARRDVSEKTPEDKVREEEERREKGRALLAQRQTLMSQFVTDICDVWIPANALGYTNLNDGVIGLLGAFTSYTALQTLWLKHSAAAASARKTV